MLDFWPEDLNPVWFRRLVSGICLSALVMTVASQGRAVVLSASCGASCEPAPRGFAVGRGEKARGFQVLNLVPGRYCSGLKGSYLAGFSIRRGRETMLVYYRGPQGMVSDPVPLEDLALPPGQYTLLAAPAQGASVTLSFTLGPGE